MGKFPASWRWIGAAAVAVFGLSAVFFLSGERHTALAFSGRSALWDRAGSAEAPSPARTLIVTPTATPFQPLPTFTPISSPTPTVTPISSLTPTATRPPDLPLPSPPPTHTPSATEPSLLPPQAYVEGVEGSYQLFPLSCEASAAVDFAAFFGSAISEVDFQNNLPASDNPDEGFVGSPYGYLGQIPPAPYGVHAAPVARLLRSYGVGAHAHQNMRFEALQREVAAGRPVIVWVVGAVEGGSPISYTTADGRTTTVACYQHVVLIIGYTQNTVLVLDGAMVYERPISLFQSSWGVLENQAITRVEDP